MCRSRPRQQTHGSEQRHRSGWAGPDRISMRTRLGAQARKIGVISPAARRKADCVLQGGAMASASPSSSARGLLRRSSAAWSGNRLSRALGGFCARSGIRFAAGYEPRVHIAAPPWFVAAHAKLLPHARQAFPHVADWVTVDQPCALSLPARRSCQWIESSRARRREIAIFGPAARKGQGGKAAFFSMRPATGRALQIDTKR